MSDLVLRFHASEYGIVDASQTNNIPPGGVKVAPDDEGAEGAKISESDGKRSEVDESDAEDVAGAVEDTPQTRRAFSELADYLAAKGLSRDVVAGWSVTENQRGDAIFLNPAGRIFRSKAEVARFVKAAADADERAADDRRVEAAPPPVVEAARPPPVVEAPPPAADAEGLLFEGDAIEARCRGGAWYPGRVAFVHEGGGAIDVAYDDGDAEERVPRAFVRPLARRRAAVRSGLAGVSAAPLAPGTHVDVYWDGDDAFYPGTVTSERDATGRVEVTYCDESTERLELAATPLAADEVPAPGARGVPFRVLDELPAATCAAETSALEKWRREARVRAAAAAPTPPDAAVPVHVLLASSAAAAASHGRKRDAPTHRDDSSSSEEEEKDVAAEASTAASLGPLPRRIDPENHGVPSLGRFVRDSQDASAREGMVVEVKGGGWRVMLSADGARWTQQNSALDAVPGRGPPAMLVERCAALGIAYKATDDDGEAAPRPIPAKPKAAKRRGRLKGARSGPSGVPYVPNDVEEARKIVVEFLDKTYGAAHDGAPCPPALYSGWSVVLSGCESKPTKILDGAGGLYRTQKDAARAMGALAGPFPEFFQNSKYAKTPFGAQRALLLESAAPSPPAAVPSPPPSPPPPASHEQTSSRQSTASRAATPQLSPDALALAAQRFGLSLPARPAAPGPPAPWVVAAEELAAAVSRAERAEAQVAERDETIRGLRETVAALEACARRAASARPPPRGSGAILDLEAELRDDDAEEEQAVGRSLKKLAQHMPIFVGSDDVAGARAGTLQYFDRVYAATHDGEPCPLAHYAGWSVVLTVASTEKTKFVDGDGAVYRSRSEAAHAMGILAGQPSKLAPKDQKWAETPYGDRRALLFEPGGVISPAAAASPPPPQRAAPPSPSPAAAEAPPAPEPEVADEEEPAAPAAEEAPPSPPPAAEEAPEPDVADEEAPAAPAAAPAPAAARRPAARAKPNRVAFTCTDGDPVLESRHGRAQHVSSGGLVVAESATEADVLVTGPRLEVKTSLAIAVARGVPVVTTAWLRECASRGFAEPRAAHASRDAAFERRHGLDLGVRAPARCARRYAVAVEAGYALPDRPRYKAAAEAAGAVWITAAARTPESRELLELGDETAFAAAGLRMHPTDFLVAILRREDPADFVARAVRPVARGKQKRGAPAAAAGATPKREAAARAPPKRSKPEPEVIDLTSDDERGASRKRPRKE